MRRREVLGALLAGIAGSLAGCSEVDATLRMYAVDDERLANRYATDSEMIHGDSRRIVVEAIEEGETVVETEESLFAPDRPVGHEGSYYEVSREVLDRTDETEYEIAVDYDPDSSTPEVGKIRFEELPPVDREALGEALPPPSDDHPGVVVRPVYLDVEIERSVLVPDQEYDVVVYDGERYVIEVRDGKSRTVSEYRYTATKIADDDADLASDLRERYLFELTGLSDAQRKIVDAAREGGYREDEPSRAFRNLAARFHEQEGIDTHEYGGNWIASYEGDDYWSELSTPSYWLEGTVARETPTEY